MFSMNMNDVMIYCCDTILKYCYLLFDDVVGKKVDPWDRDFAPNLPKGRFSASDFGFLDKNCLRNFSDTFDST